MCICIVEIKESYTKVRCQTAEVAQQQFDIDDYLDRVNVVRKELEQITDETNNLVELVRDHFTEFDIQETVELLAHSTPILILMDQLHQKLVESPLYSGLKTAVENYRDCVSDFQELCTDLQTFNIDVPRSEKCRETEEQLKKIEYDMSAVYVREDPNSVYNKDTIDVNMSEERREIMQKLSKLRNCYYNQKDYREAIDVIRQAIELSLKNDYPWMTYEEAVKAFNRGEIEYGFGEVD